MGIGRDEFLILLKVRFPEVSSQIGRYQNGLLHCEVAALRQATELAMDAGDLWKAEQHFRLVCELLSDAGPELKNALEISYLQDLALGDCTPARYHAISQRMPKLLKQILARHSDNWL